MREGKTMKESIVKDIMCKMRPCEPEVRRLRVKRDLSRLSQETLDLLDVSL